MTFDCEGAAFSECVRTVDAIRRHVVTLSKTPPHTSAQCLSAPHSGSPLRAEVDPGTGNGAGHLVVLRSEHALKTGYGKYGAHKGRRELLSCFPAQVTCAGSHQEPVCSCLATKGEGLGSGCWVLWCFCPPCPVAWLLDHPDFERNPGDSHLMMGASSQPDCQFCGDKDVEGPTSPSP